MTRDPVHTMRALSMSRPDGPVVLVVEDVPEQLTMLSVALQARGYRVVEAGTATDALDLVAGIDPDVILLDLGLPDLDGIEACRQLKLWVTSPIIVVTADGSEERIVAALDEGADDYVTKPYSMAELLARVRVALRHRSKASTNVQQQFTLGDVEVDVAAHAVAIAGEPLELQPRQFKLLTILGSNAGKVLSYRTLTSQIWGPEHTKEELASLRVTVSSLRARLGTGPERPVIHNAPHVGYRLTVPEARQPAIG